VVAILKRARPSTALTKQAGNIQGPLHVARSDRDADGSVDDWSPKDQSRRRKKPRGWTKDDIAEVNKRKPAQHPFEQLVDNLATGHGIPRYLAMAHARHQAPQSYRHYQQQGVDAARAKPMRKAAPDAAAVAWDAAVSTWVDRGLSRTEAMRTVRKAAPKLWRQYR
jgi:hypothetical protein